jgi:hypothetical protein
MGCSSDVVSTSPETTVTKVSLVSSRSVIPFEEPNFDELAVVDKAYALLGIERVRFDPTNPSVLPSHREYLTQCMAIIDQAVVWRVSGCQAILNGTLSEGYWAEAGDNLVSSLGSLNVPKGLESHAEAISQCLLSYCNFFSRHADGGSEMLGQDWQSDRDLRVSSNAAREAYNILNVLHFRADAYTKTAFYNTHMALDPF